MKKKRQSYNFEGMEINDSKFHVCKQADRDRLRNSLQGAARKFGISVTTSFESTGIRYTRVEPKQSTKQKGEG